jgi:hypothetical protein
LIAQDLQGFLVRRDDLPGRLDLRAQRRLLDGGGDDIGGQRDVRRLQREALRVRCAASDSTCRRLAPNTSGTNPTVSCAV